MEYFRTIFYLHALMFAGTVGVTAQERVHAQPLQLQADTCGIPSTRPALSKAEGFRGAGMMFTQNKGQIIDTKQQLRPDILFKGDGAGADIYIRKTGISYVLSKTDEKENETAEQAEEMAKDGRVTEQDEQKIRLELLKKQRTKLHRIDVDFLNCNLNTQLQTANQVEGYNNYYYAHCPQGITHVNSYNEITVKNIYNNIDIKYYGGKQMGLKYDIIVNPGADPNQVQLKYSGATELRIINGNSSTGLTTRLKIKTSAGELGEYMPKVYQNINGKIIDVKAEFVLNETTVNFELGTWNRSFPLVIDPWASYFGGNAEERGLSVTTDPLGNVAFTGYTGSTNFPASPGAFQTSIPDNRDAFIVKMNSAGNRLWATYYGGPDWDFGIGITSDNSANIIVTGSTMSNAFPVSAGAFQPAFGGGNNQGDAFLVQLDPTGARIWATYYGGTLNDAGTDVTTDGTNIYLYGTAQSANAIATPGAFQPVFNGVANGNNLDCFVAKFSSAGNRTWGTYIGGTGTNGECSDGIACDVATGNIYITGTTNSTNFPVTAGAYHPVYSSTNSDGFLFKLSPAGARIWATYCNISNSGNGSAVAVDGMGNVIIGGDNGSDSYIAKFNSTGSFLWSKGLGSNTGNYICGVATDADNNIYAYGEFEDFGPGTYAGTCPHAYQANFGGSATPPTAEDEFISKYDPAGNQLCFTFMGGPGEDELDPSTGFKGTFGSVGTWGGGSGIAIYKNVLYITGSAPAGYPVTAGAFQTNFGGSNPWIDAFIDQLCINFCEEKTLGIGYIPSTKEVCVNTPITFAPMVNNSCDTSGYKFLWTFTGATPGTSTSSNPSISYSTPGSYSVKLVVTTPCNKDSVTNSNYINVSSCTVNATATGATICPNSCAVITSSGSNGTSPYTYTWSNGGSGATISVCPATTTTYTVTVKDANGTAVKVNPTVIVKPPLTINTSVTNITCTVNGAAEVTSMSGTPPFTYSWSNGSMSYNITNVAAGNYTLTITDGNGCTGTKTMNISSSSPASAAFTFVPACVGQPTVFTNTGTTGTYNWSVSANPAVSGTGANFSYTFLTAGTYSVTHSVTTSGCTSTVTSNVTIASCNPPTVTAANSSVCPGSCTTVTSTGTGGTLPYTYSWSTGATSQNINACPPATTTYTVKITDAGGSTATTSATVTINPAINVTATPILNCGTNSGSVTATVTGGSSSFTYSWSNGVTTTTNGLTSQISNLSSNNYSITVTDANGCSASSNAIIDPPLTAQYIKGTANCTGCGCKEWVMVTPSNGRAPYTYSWPNGYDKRYLNKICPGSYTIITTDKNGCSVNVVVNAP